MTHPRTSNEPWPAPVAPGPLSARVEVPGSKSATNRALVLAALSDGPSTVRGALDARDTRLMREALVALGCRVDVNGAAWTVTPPTRPVAAGRIDCGLAGTVMRFLPPVAALAEGTTTFTGDPAASERPMAPVLDGLRQLGAAVDGDRLPFSVTGPTELEGREVTIDASASSQFVSGLLLAAARMPHGLVLRHLSAAGAEVPSRPHIDMTVDMLAAHGVTATETEPGTWQVLPGPVLARDERIEPDLTSAAVFLAAAAVAGGQVTVPGWPQATTQGGDQVRGVLERMGAGVVLDGDELTVTGTGTLRGIDVDLHEASELTPVVAALGLLATGTTTIRGVAHIRGHETDRLAALEAELRRVGGTVQQTADGLAITGAGLSGYGLHAADLLSYADHRMVHTAALLGLVVPGVAVDDVACTSKTLTDFDQMWQDLVAPRATTAGRQGVTA